MYQSYNSFWLLYGVPQLAAINTAANVTNFKNRFSFFIIKSFFCRH